MLVSYIKSAISFNRLCLAIACMVLLTTCVQPGDIPSSYTTIGALNTAEQAQYQQALHALSKEHYDEAERILNSIITSHQSFAGPYINLAIIYYRQNRHNKALTYINNALQRNPSHTQAHNLKGIIDLDNGRLDTAITAFTKAITLDPDYANAHYNLALLYDIYYHDLEKAVMYYENYLALIDKPDNETRDWLIELKRILNNA